MKKQRFNPDEGFSLLEVLVAILIVTFFTTVAMQMMVISAAFKAKAKEYTTAATLIEKDLENVRNLANAYRFPTIASPAPTVNANSLILSSVNGLSNNDNIQLQGASNSYTGSSPVSSPTPRITISPAITSTPPGLGTTVVSNTSCKATSANSDQGLANYLKTNIESTVTSSPTPITISSVSYKSVVGNPYTLPNTGKKIWLMRNDSYDFTGSVSPYDVLRLNYVVVKDNGNTPSTNVIAKLSSEVIPYASFQCIQ
ncbi:type II secretion system protein [Sphaerospermopsis aphanizomenoides BCCUSP55]|uniref:type II secretion system protein n=1 Tax=Sphaerospermopsis aphanizomenoides TaxID=459663 RepID=UPI0019056E65|nr:type II secretion system protein [Sphaerospermopsis aphanizomenoides]MBK1989840.1 type II secretion system protein [Sphaerospermopsis aphanizomenoides BCCUSP55]